jgi:hypothetical protein
MKRNFTDENFEDFLRHSADGLRMRPSDKVWKGISRNLNKRKRRGGFFLGSLVIALSITGYLVADHSMPAAAKQSASSGTNTQQPTDRGNTGGTIATGNILTNRAIPGNPDISALQTASADLLSGGMPALVIPISRNPAFSSQAAQNSVLLEPGLQTEEAPSAQGFTPTIVDNYSDEHPSQNVASSEKAKAASLPLTIESVVNSYRPKFSKKKLSWQFYVTPTISYRKLSENKTFLRNQPDVQTAARSASSNVNNEVTHKPSLGLEVGMAAKYSISKNIKLTGGFQVNVTRYDIKAYSSSSEVATIMLNVGGTHVDSMNTVTGYSNTDGYQSDWLQNLYFQISAPIGAEFRLGGNDKVHFGVATTIQPTYVLGDKSYLISTDYKNYAEVPDLTRRWNVNTSLETFVGFSAGKIAWQVGPQVRYQLLSSFISKYPVKENLFDFGLRLGISIAK